MRCAERAVASRPQVAVVKAFASALCIGGGGSVGREGPIVQIGSAPGSTPGRPTPCPAEDRCACWWRAVQPGVSRRRSTRRSPGRSSRSELILRDFAAESFGDGRCCRIVTAERHRSRRLRHSLFLDLPAFHSEIAGIEYLSFALLGLFVIGAVGVVFIAGPVQLRGRLRLGLARAGCGCGRPTGGAAAWRATHGATRRCTGSDIRSSTRHRRRVRLLASSSSCWSASSIAVGLTIGSVAPEGSSRPAVHWRDGRHRIWHGYTNCSRPFLAPLALYGLIGMGAVFAAASRAAITAVTHPLRADRRIHDRPSADGGHRHGHPRLPGSVQRDDLHPQIDPSRGQPRCGAPPFGPRPGSAHRCHGHGTHARTDCADTPIETASRALWLSANGVLPVSGADQRYHGCVTARAVTEALAADEAAGATVADLAVMPDKITETSTRRRSRRPRRIRGHRHPGPDPRRPHHRRLAHPPRHPHRTGKPHPVTCTAKSRVTGCRQWPAGQSPRSCC